MGLWSKNIIRSHTGEYRTEDVGDVLHAMSRLRKFMSDCICIVDKTGEVSFTVSGTTSNWSVRTKRMKYEFDISFTSDDFDYSIYLKMKTTVNRLNDIDEYDEGLECVVYNMNRNMTKYLMGMTNQLDSDILYKISNDLTQ